MESKGRFRLFTIVIALLLVGCFAESFSSLQNLYMPLPIVR